MDSGQEKKKKSVSKEENYELAKCAAWHEYNTVKQFWGILQRRVVQQQPPLQQRAAEDKC